ncbi:hypothetical protein POVCU2_0078330 [Plasmodium ovale curtisi]|uniref:Uncharacterized protein n=1 Tax=Plasmodium ovale curtisi TaxID=864141 RepID=A0A1A8WJ74_PLAOA|nr:hypothetical protein POVCU2_0078330 [Plasmodium ovale curtisi]
MQDFSPCTKCISSTKKKFREIDSPIEQHVLNVHDQMNTCCKNKKADENLNTECYKTEIKCRKGAAYYLLGLSANFLFFFQ